MTYSDEKLSAYLDGELPPEETAAIRDALEKDVLLRDRLARLQRADAAVRAAYGAIDDTPLPESVTDLLKGGAAEKRPAGPEGNIRFFPAMRRRAAAAPWPVAIAASLAMVVGFISGQQLSFSPDAPSGAVQMARVIEPNTPLFEVLNRGVSAQTHQIASDADLRLEPVLSFRRLDGSYCREFFAHDANSRTHSVACKEEENWIIKIAVTTSAGNTPEGAYETASTAGDTLVTDYIDRIISGDALSAEEEEDLSRSDWQ